MAFSDVVGNLKRVRARKDVFARHYRFDRTVSRLINAKPGPLPRYLIPQLFAHWGDPVDRADEGYLGSCLAHIEKSDGHTLQCGTGLTTLLLGIVCARSALESKHLWCLVDDAHWANVMRSWLTQYGITHTHVIVSRPQLQPGYIWYSVNAKQFPKDFSLALCEGGSASVSGARGLITRMESRMTQDCVILARHVLTSADQQNLKTWAKTQNRGCVIVDKKEGFFKVAVHDADETGRFGDLPI